MNGMSTDPGAVLISGGFCPFCWSDSGGLLRNDKKGRPYFRCDECLSKAFIYTTKAVNGAFFWLRRGTSLMEKIHEASKNVPQVPQVPSSSPDVRSAS